MSTKFGLHVTFGPRDGYGPVAAAAPAVVIAVGEGGALVEAREKSDGRTVTIFREQNVFHDAPGGIDHMSLAEARRAADHYWPALKGKYEENQADYYQVTNETGGDNRKTLANIFAFETRLMELAKRDGYKLAVASPAGGSPGSWELWVELFVPHIRRAGQGGHIYSRHAYGGVATESHDGLLTVPGPAPADDNAGRPFREAEYLRQQGINTPMVITEAGPNAGYRFPGVDTFMEDMIRYDQLCLEHDNIWGFCSWTYGNYQDRPANIQDASSRMATYLQSVGGAVRPQYPVAAQPEPGTSTEAEAASVGADIDLNPATTGTTPQVTALNETGTVTATAGLNLRSEPSTVGRDETIIDLLKVGSKVTIVGRLNGWYQVRVDDKVGYVSADYVSVGPPPPRRATGSSGPVRASTGFQPGMNINIGVHHPDVDRLRGLSWVRFVFIAADQKRSLDEAFNHSYGPLIREYAAAGIKSLIILNHETEHGNTPWSNGDWEAYADHFGRAARRVATLCAPFGNNVAFQIWNEQDSGWSADKGNPNPSARGLLPEHYALILDAAVSNIREAAPHASVVSGGLKTGPENGRDYLRATSAQLGGRLPVDAIAYHPYGRYVTTDPFYGHKHGILADALAVFKRSFPGLPLWITEIGIPGHENAIGPEHYDDIALYMREFVTEIANHHADHVPVLIWFAWTDRMENAGILTADGREKEGIYAAFQAMKARGVRGGVAKGISDLGERSADFALEALERAATEVGYVTAPAGLNLRSEPSTVGRKDTIIMALVLGTQVKILERNNGWYRVRTGDQEGYVSADYISAVAPGRQTMTSSAVKRFKRRKTGSVIGIHGAPGGAAPPKHLWGHWTDYLKEMGIRWYKQCETSDGTGDGSIFKWVLHLKRNGIEPIVRYLVSAQFPDNLEQRFIDQMRRYAAEGVRWAEIGNEPNLNYEWKDAWRGKYEGKWPHGNWVQEPRMRWSNPESIATLARVWVEDATRAADVGAWPAFYAFGPTDWGSSRPHGFYSSTMFTDLVVERLAKHHRDATVKLFRERNAWIAVHVAKYEKDFNYDPYSENPNKPWDMSLRGYEVVLNAFRRHFGRDLDVGAIPIISTEGGVFVPEHRNRIDNWRLPANDEEHARQTVEMFRFVEQATPLTAMCPWCIAEGHHIIGHGTDEFRDHGWFKEENGRIKERPVYPAMQQLRREKGVKSVQTRSIEPSLKGSQAPEAERKTVLVVNLQIQVEVEGDPNKIVVSVDS